MTTGLLVFNLNVELWQGVITNMFVVSFIYLVNKSHMLMIFIFLHIPVLLQDAMCRICLTITWKLIYTSFHTYPIYCVYMYQELDNSSVDMTGSFM